MVSETMEACMEIRATPVDHEQDTVQVPGERMRHEAALCEAGLRGDCALAAFIISNNPNVLSARLTKRNDTALHIATAARHTRLVAMLVQWMEREDLGLRNLNGHTALYTAAASGIVEMAKAMVEVNTMLPYVRGNNGLTPLFMATFLGHREMVMYLMSVTDLGLLSQDERCGLLIAAINSNLYGELSISSTP